MQWSPCSTYVLVLTAAHPPFGAGQWGRPWRAWSVVEAATGKVATSGTPVLLTEACEQMLPFWEQYARGTATPWAPDGSAFAYAALDETDGCDAVFVQSVGRCPETGRPQLASPKRVCYGVMVTWSPR